MAEKKYIQSVNRALEILEFIAKKRISKLNEICLALDLKAPTAYALLQTLENKSYIQRVGKTQYSLGLNSLKLGLMYDLGEEKTKSIHIFLTELVNIVNETCYFEIKIGNLNYFQDYVLSSQSLKVVPIESHYDELLDISAVNKAYKNCNENIKFETDLEQVQNGLNCMAIPYKNDNKIVATIAFTGPSFRFNLEKMEKAYEAFLLVMNKYKMGNHI
ncbi:MAG: helix-turn-helix domain-containing protein [Spirochaetaceae bacterium]|nr:helix-turn-helix domain-containing protein [Spirochaetaceae bacterium]